MKAWIIPPIVVPLALFLAVIVIGLVRLQG